MYNYKPFRELLRAEFGMFMGAEERVIKLLLAKLADKALSRCSSMEQANNNNLHKYFV